MSKRKNHVFISASAGIINSALSGLKMIFWIPIALCIAAISIAILFTLARSAWGTLYKLFQEVLIIFTKLFFISWPYLIIFILLIILTIATWQFFESNRQKKNARERGGRIFRMVHFQKNEKHAICSSNQPTSTVKSSSILGFFLKKNYPRSGANQIAYINAFLEFSGMNSGMMIQREAVELLLGNSALSHHLISSNFEISNDYISLTPKGYDHFYGRGAHLKNRADYEAKTAAWKIFFGTGAFADTSDSQIKKLKFETRLKLQVTPRH